MTFKCPYHVLDDAHPFSSLLSQATPISSRKRQPRKFTASTTFVLLFYLSLMQDYFNNVWQVSLPRMMQICMASCSKWLRGKNCQTNMAISRYFAFHRCSHVSTAYIRWRPKDMKKVNMDSLTNFVKDIAAFWSLISAATSCHATATALSRRRFFLLMWKLENQNHTWWGKFTAQCIPVRSETRRYWISTLFFVHFLRMKLSK